MKKNKTFVVALGGICLALTLIFMFAGSIVPGIELTLFAISSLFIAVMIIESGVGGAVILYVAAVLLGFILIPNKFAIIPYALFFGYYGIVKYFIEKLNGGILQIAIKLALFAALLSVMLLGFEKLMANAIGLPDYPSVILIIGGMLLLLLYDYIYTLIINFYLRRFKNKGMDNIKLS